MSGPLCSSRFKSLSVRGQSEDETSGGGWGVTEGNVVGVNCQGEGCGRV